MITKKMSTKGIIYLLIATIIYGIMPVFIRFLNAGNMPPLSQVFLRYIVAFLTAATYFIFSKSKLKINKKTLALLIFVGVFGYGMTNLLFTYGVLYTKVSNALFIFYGYAIITPVFGYLLLKEKINKIAAFALVVSFIALLLLFQPNGISTWKLGGLLAFGAALTQAFYLIGRKKLTDYNSQTMLLVSTFLGMVSVGVLAIFFESQFLFSGMGVVSKATWLVTFIFGLGNFFAWLMLSKGFALLNSSTGSLIMLLENVFAVFFAFSFLGEIPPLTTILGGSLILFSAMTVIFKGDQS